MDILVNMFSQFMGSLQHQHHRLMFLFNRTGLARVVHFAVYQVIPLRWISHGKLQSLYYMAFLVSKSIRSATMFFYAF
jgi:hypothetical protein